MRTGLRCGDSRWREDAPVLSVFCDDEEGFTTVAVALALLLSLTLVFAAASAGWVGSRSAEIQNVADATAMAGANAVAAFSTIVQVIDACSLSLGLTGIVVLGAGLVLACIPGLTAVGARVSLAGKQVLDARASFVRSATAGVEKLEVALPFIVVANSASCVAANSDDGLSYLGCALPFPLKSGSDFSALSAEVDDAGMEELSERMREVSQEADEAYERMGNALERGWLADCGSTPYSLYERAGSLGGLRAGENPYYPTSDTWSFGAALARARAYYEARLNAEVVRGSNAEELTDSACRRAFYDYALREVQEGYWIEREDGGIDSRMPSLPRNAEEARASSLYTQQAWPCTVENGTRVLHCSLSCPGALGSASGQASLEQLDAGSVVRCGSCQMDVGELGRVAAASSSIENGFEYHWRKVVEASEDYRAAREEWAEAEARTRELAEEGEQAFEGALGQLDTGGPTLCPPGAWGCVAVVSRAEGSEVPSELTAAFLESESLPAGMAISASTLAPDEDTDGGNVLASFFDSLGAGDSVVGGSLDGLLSLWGSLLVGYGSACEGIADAGGSFLDGLDGVLGGTTGSWLKGQLKGILEATGFAPVDMRLRKPVLTNSQDVLDQSGYDDVGTVRELVSRLPDATSPYEFARSFGVELTDGASGSKITVAELEIPGTGISLPLTIDLSTLGVAP